MTDAAAMRPHQSPGRTPCGAVPFRTTPAGGAHPDATPIGGSLGGVLSRADLTADLGFMVGAPHLASPPDAQRARQQAQCLGELTPVGGSAGGAAGRALDSSRLPSGAVLGSGGAPWHASPKMSSHAAGATAAASISMTSPPAPRRSLGLGHGSLRSAGAGGEEELGFALTGGDALSAGLDLGGGSGGPARAASTVRSRKLSGLSFTIRAAGGMRGGSAAHKSKAYPAREDRHQWAACGSALHHHVFGSKRGTGHFHFADALPLSLARVPDQVAGVGAGAGGSQSAPGDPALTTPPRPRRSRHGATAQGGKGVLTPSPVTGPKRALQLTGCGAHNVASWGDEGELVDDEEEEEYEGEGGAAFVQSGKGGSGAAGASRILGRRGRGATRRLADEEGTTRRSRPARRIRARVRNGAAGARAEGEEAVLAAGGPPSPTWGRPTVALGDQRALSVLRREEAASKARVANIVHHALLLSAPCEGAQEERVAAVASELASLFDSEAWLMRCLKSQGEGEAEAEAAAWEEEGEDAAEGDELTGYAEEYELALRVQARGGPATAAGRRAAAAAAAVVAGTAPSGPSAPPFTPLSGQLEPFSSAAEPTGPAGGDKGVGCTPGQRAVKAEGEAAAPPSTPPGYPGLGSMLSPTGPVPRTPPRPTRGAGALGNSPARPSPGAAPGMWPDFVPSHPLRTPDPLRTPVGTPLRRGGALRPEAEGAAPPAGSAGLPPPWGSPLLTSGFGGRDASWLSPTGPPAPAGEGVGTGAEGTLLFTSPRADATGMLRLERAGTSVIQSPGLVPGASRRGAAETAASGGTSAAPALGTRFPAPAQSPSDGRALRKRCRRVHSAPRGEGEGEGAEAGVTTTPRKRRFAAPSTPSERKEQAELARRAAAITASEGLACVSPASRRSTPSTGRGPGSASRSGPTQGDADLAASRPQRSSALAASWRSRAEAEGGPGAQRKGNGMPPLHPDVGPPSTCPGSTAAVPVAANEALPPLWRRAAAPFSLLASEASPSPATASLDEINAAVGGDRVSPAGRVECGRIGVSSRCADARGGARREGGRGPQSAPSPRSCNRAPLAVSVSSAGVALQPPPEAGAPLARAVHARTRTVRTTGGGRVTFAVRTEGELASRQIAVS